MKKNIKYIILFIIFLVLVVGILLLILNTNKNRMNNLSKDKKIGYLLLDESLDDPIEIDRMNVVYDKKTNVFEVGYIINDNEGSYDDEIVISTSDFVDYSVSTTYFKEGIPSTVSSNGPELINYKVKNEAIKLAKELNYSVGDVLNTRQYKKVLGILNETKIGDYIKIFEKNGYDLENYYSLKNNNIGFLYRLDDKNFLEIKSYNNNSKGWSVYGISKKKLSKDFSSASGNYVIDKNITLDDKQSKEIKNIIKDYLD